MVLQQTLWHWVHKSFLCSTTALNSVTCFLSCWLFYGASKQNSNVNAFFLNWTIEFILSSGRFNWSFKMFNLMFNTFTMFFLSIIHSLHGSSWLTNFLFWFYLFISFTCLYTWCPQYVTPGFAGCLLFIINFYFLSFFHFTI